MRRALTLVASALLLVIADGCGGGPKAQEETKAKPEAKASTNVRNGSAHETDRIYSLALHVEQTSLNRDHNTTVSVTALYENNETEDVTQRVEWRVEPKGAAEIEEHTLKAKEDTNATVTAELDGVHSNPVKLNIYWEVNGHRLPPEPNPKINNATLLGLDSNHNGVRDDVERWIYKTYDHPIERAAFMQLAKALQHSMGHADEALKYFQPIDDAASCASYWTTFMKYKNQNNAIRADKTTSISNELSPIQYNTETRCLDNENFENALSGGVIEDNGLEPEELIKKCDFNATELMKDHQ